MICLDTNQLILALQPGSREADRLITWARKDERLVVLAIVWQEFLCGDRTPAQVSVMRNLLQEVVASDETQAVTAARLFNATGRKRSLRIDALIAACAISSGARLATNNPRDFERFVPLGLLLER